INIPSENNLDLSYIEPVILIQSQLENDVSMNNRIIGELDENLSNKNDISTAINIALKQVGFLFLLLDDDNIHKLDTSDLTEQVDLIQNIQPSSSLIL
ncbi:13471_t:CDS:1, partial [Funneliformis geosporum]